MVSLKYRSFSNLLTRYLQPGICICCFFCQSADPVDFYPELNWFLTGAKPSGLEAPTYIFNMTVDELQRLMVWEVRAVQGAVLSQGHLAITKRG